VVGAILNRAEAQVLRLSSLYAVLDCSAEVRSPHLRAALALWRYAEASARLIFGSRLGVLAADVVLEALRARGPLTATAISALFGRHRSAEEIHGALQLLQDLGLVTRSAEAAGGRAPALWAACEGGEKSERSERPPPPWAFVRLFRAPVTATTLPLMPVIAPCGQATTLSCCRVPSSSSMFAAAKFSSR
jgi:hypothetical protein